MVVLFDILYRDMKTEMIWYLLYNFQELSTSYDNFFKFEMNQSTISGDEYTKWDTKL